MARIAQKPLKQDWLKGLQEGSCLLCPFPLPLGCHLHHIIACDDHGPDHPLNYVALCPNCHLVLEYVRRHIAPQEKRGGKEWFNRAKPAMAYLNALADNKKQLFNALAEPHKCRNDIRKPIPDQYRVDFAKYVAREDLRILLQIHNAFPAIVQTWRRAKSDSPHHLEPEAPIAGDDFENLISQHLSSLGLPFETEWLLMPPPRKAVIV